MRVLFLDVDGVLNSLAWAEYHGEGWNRDFDQKAVEQLLRVVRTVAETGRQIRIVVSSSWRIGHTHTGLRAKFRECGMPAELTNLIIDHTPSLPHPRIRGDEIAAWLMTPTGMRVESFAIVDDGDDMGCQKDRLVQTSWEYGLMREDADRLIEMLS